MNLGHLREIIKICAMLLAIALSVTFFVQPEGCKARKLYYACIVN